MMSRNDLTTSIQKARKRLTRPEAEVAEYEKALQGLKQIQAEAAKVKQQVAAHLGDPEQKVFAFLPTQMTRISPFFPMSRRDQRQDRPFEKVDFEHSWGRITFEGRRLAVADETLLLALLSLVRKHNAGTFETTRYELCQVLNVTRSPGSYKAIWGSLERLSGTRIDLELWETKGRKKVSTLAMTNTILSGARMDKSTGKILVTINPYFLALYAESLVTNLDLQLRAKIKGDTGKALYRFIEGQRDNPYQCHLLTLAKAINLNLDLPTRELRKRIRKGLAELRKAGRIRRSQMTKTDIVKVWKR